MQPIDTAVNLPISREEIYQRLTSLGIEGATCFRMYLPINEATFLINLIDTKESDLPQMWNKNLRDGEIVGDIEFETESRPAEDVESRGYFLLGAIAAVRDMKSPMYHISETDALSCIKMVSFYFEDHRVIICAVPLGGEIDYRDDVEKHSVIINDSLSDYLCPAEDSPRVRFQVAQ